MNVRPPIRLAESLARIQREHPRWTERDVLAANRDYAGFLATLKRTPDGQLLRLGRQLPAHRLHFLALTLMHDDPALREQAARILRVRPRGSHFSLLFPYFASFPTDPLLREVLALSLGCLRDAPLLALPARRLLETLLQASDPPRRAADQILDGNQRVDVWLSQLGLPLDSEFALQLLVHLAGQGWGARADEGELRQLDSLLFRLPPPVLFRLLADAIRHGQTGPASRLACVAVDRFGPPRLADDWSAIPFDICESARELQVDRQWTLLADRFRRFLDYEPVRAQLEAILVRGGTAFLIGRGAVFAEPLSAAVDGAVLDAAALRLLLAPGEPQLSAGLVRRRLSADREARRDDLARQLALHLDRPGRLARLKRRFLRWLSRWKRVTE